MRNKRAKLSNWHLRDVELEELHSQTLTEALHGKLGSRVDVVKHHSYQASDDRQEFSGVPVYPRCFLHTHPMTSITTLTLHSLVHPLLPCTVITSVIRQAQRDRPVVWPRAKPASSHSPEHTCACSPCSPITLLTTMMCPPFRFFMSGMTSLIMRITPKKLVSKTFFISSMGMLSSGPTRPIPALLTVRRRKKIRFYVRKKRQTSNSARHCEDVFYPLRTSTCRSLIPLIHCLTDSSLQTSRTARERVFPYASPAASTSLSLRFRSRIVAITVNKCRWRETDLVNSPHYVDDTLYEDKDCKKESSNFLMFVCQCLFFASYFWYHRYGHDQTLSSHLTY